MIVKCILGWKNDVYYFNQKFKSIYDKSGNFNFSVGTYATEDR